MKRDCPDIASAVDRVHVPEETTTTNAAVTDVLNDAAMEPEDDILTCPPGAREVDADVSPDQQYEAFGSSQSVGDANNADTVMHTVHTAVPTIDAGRDAHFPQKSADSTDDGVNEATGVVQEAYALQPRPDSDVPDEPTTNIDADIGAFSEPTSETFDPSQLTDDVVDCDTNGSATSSGAPTHTACKLEHLKQF